MGEQVRARMMMMGVTFRDLRLMIRVCMTAVASICQRKCEQGGAYLLPKILQLEILEFVLLLRQRRCVERCAEDMYAKEVAPT